MVIDGLDASGKTTQANRLSRFLKSCDKTVCLRIHPCDDNFWGAQAKRFLEANGRSAHFASALFYMFDVIHSILLYCWRDYDYTIFVRYLLGTTYLPSPLDKIAYYFFALFVPKPETTLFIDVQPTAAYKRIKRRVSTRPEMFEKPEALGMIRRKGIAMASFANWIIVDGSKPPVEVELSIRSLLKHK